MGAGTSAVGAVVETFVIPPVTLKQFDDKASRDDTLMTSSKALSSLVVGTAAVSDDVVVAAVVRGNCVVDSSPHAEVRTREGSSNEELSPTSAALENATLRLGMNCTAGEERKVCLCVKEEGGG